MSVDVELLEKEAYTFLAQEKLEAAYRLFKKAAKRYQHLGNHKQAALMFASAASCWSRKAGENTFYNAAQSYEAAAHAAVKVKDYEYGSLLYKYAAVNHERDGEFLDFSRCFYRSKQCYRTYLVRALFLPKRVISISKERSEPGIRSGIKKLCSLLASLFSWLIWGYGECPARTFFAGSFIILFSTFFYCQGFLAKGYEVIQPSLSEAFYFSVTTFTTVGYGDLVPVGLSKVMVIIESLSGLFIIPLFVIGLSRKYLRF